MTDFRALWKKHGGDFFGPNVEHASMEYQKWWKFCEELSSPSPELTQLVKAARAMADQDTMHNDGTLALVNASELAALRAALVPFKEVE